MKEIIIDGRLTFCLNQVHRQFKDSLVLGGYYGANLDALWDVLSSYSEGLRVQFIDNEALRRNLGQDYERLVELFLDLEEENQKFIFQEKEEE